jgi:hypothetical protein
LNTILLIQSLCNRFILKENLSEEDRRIQQLFRVHLSAFLFAAVHLFNPHETVLSALIQFSVAYISGVSLAYMMEKYYNLSATILAHGIHNAICEILTLSKVSDPRQCVVVVVYEISVYILATTSIDVYLISSIRRIGEFCVAIPRKFVNCCVFNYKKVPVKILPVHRSIVAQAV